MPDAVHWVNKYLVPLKACGKARRRARKFTDPQAAWDAWKSASELLWCLRAARADGRKIILCACEIVELALPVFEEEYPSNAWPRKAVEAAQRYMLEPTRANNVAAYDHAYLADCSFDPVPYGTTWRAAARAAANAVKWPIDAAAFAYEACYFSEAKRKAMADIVRRHFPIAPVPAED